MPFAVILALSGLAVAAQSGLFSGSLEPEAREYATVMWGVAGALVLGGFTIIILNGIRKRKTGNSGKKLE
ncbi:MAG: hypothetical protein JW712_03785 [Dehalococcoidales bacterium]|nr:hypothetical protein [Dehalococcoidales bacterium]